MGVIQPSPIIAAMEKGHEDTALLLLSSPGVDINKHRITHNQRLWNTVANPLFAAIQFNQPKIAEWVLDNTDIDLEMRLKLDSSGEDRFGPDAFEFAISQNNTQIAAQIAKKTIVNHMAKESSISASFIKLEMQYDERQKLAIHFVVDDQDQAKLMASATNHQWRQDNESGKYYVRLEEEKITDRGKELYASIVKAEREKLLETYKVGKSSISRGERF